MYKSVLVCSGCHNHRLGGLNIKTLLYLSSGSPRSKVLANLASAEICLPATGFMGACLLVCRHGLSSVCMKKWAGSVVSSSLAKEHLSTSVKSYLKISFNYNYLLKGPISKNGHTELWRYNWSTILFSLTVWKYACPLNWRRKWQQENPRDRAAWAAVLVTQSWTALKWQQQQQQSNRMGCLKIFLCIFHEETVYQWTE